jgi:glucosamine-6-phosphate deaminase
MRVIYEQAAPDLARTAADWIAAHLRAKPNATLALPTGNTPLGLYAELIRRSQAGAVDLSAATLFNLDEYCGLAAADIHSYAAFLHRHLIAPLGLSTTHVRLLRGDAADTDTECRAYDAAIGARGGIDLCILGLGTNGHIAFNEPGAAWDQRTHRVELSAATRNTHAQQAGAPEEIPAFGLTMGIRTILEARHILLLIAGSNKKAARQALHRGDPDRAWPVTSLLSHPSVTAIELCESAASP